MEREALLLSVYESLEQGQVPVAERRLGCTPRIQVLHSRHEEYGHRK